MNCSKLLRVLLSIAIVAGAPAVVLAPDSVQLITPVQFAFIYERLF